MALHAFRIEFADQPGMLARLSTALSRCGANIVALDIHELDGERVIDEIVVETGQSTPEVLRAALMRAGADSVVSTTVAPRLTDVVVACLDGVTAMTRAMVENRDVDATLAALVVRLALVGEVAILSAADAATGPVSARALTEGAPTVERVEPPGSTHPEWELALPYPEHDPRIVLVVRRNAGVRFSATEVARLRALLRVHDRVGALARSART